MKLSLNKVIGEPRIMAILVTKGGIERSTMERYREEIERSNKKIEEMQKMRESASKADERDDELTKPFDGEIDHADPSKRETSLAQQFLNVPYLLEGVVIGTVLSFIYFFEKMNDS